MAAEGFQEGEEKKMVKLRSEDGVEFVVSDAEASQCGGTVDFKIKYAFQNHIGGGGETSYSPIRLFVQGDTLSKVIQYSKMHASGFQDLSDWDAEFIGRFHHETLFDLILASEYLQLRGLLDLACQTIASRIKGKSPHEICSIFNIKSFLSSELLDEETIEKRLQDPNRWSQIGMPVVPSEKPHVNEELELEEKALRALDIVRCQEFTRREGDDPQLITSTDDMLTLIDPCRGLVPADRVYFEINLKIKRDGGVIKELSKGVIVFNRVRLPHDSQAMTLGLDSWLSRVELTCAYVVHPVEATIEINILKGSCSLSRVAAWTTGNFEDRIMLYHDGARPVLGDGSSVPLMRRVVAVPLGKKLVLQLIGAENVTASLKQSDGVIIREMGCGELEVKVAWTAVPRRQAHSMLKVVGNEMLLL